MTVISKPSWTTNNIFIAAPLTALKNIIESAIELLRFKPEILDRINKDQDVLAKRKRNCVWKIKSITPIKLKNYLEWKYPKKK